MTATAVTVRNLEGEVVILDQARHAIANAETQDDIEAIEIRLKAIRPEIKRVVKDQDEQRRLMREHAIAMFDLYRKGGELLEPLVAEGNASKARTGSRAFRKWHGQDVDSGDRVLGHYAERAGIARLRAERMRAIFNLPDDIYQEVRGGDWEHRTIGLQTFVKAWRKVKKQRELDAMSAREAREREYEALIAKVEKWAASGANVLHELCDLPHGWPGPAAYDRIMDTLAELLGAAERFANQKEWNHDDRERTAAG